MKYIIITVASILAVLASTCRLADRTPSVGHVHETGQTYTCPMPEDSVFSDKPGRCPKCGMDLIKMETKPDSSLESLTRPTNEFIRSSLPLVTIQHRPEDIEIEALGSIEYDTRGAVGIASRVSGRIEHLYVRYRYQKVRKGQLLMDVYSPDMLTAQENLLHFLRNDPGNLQLIQASREKLLLLGMDPRQLDEVVRTQKPVLRLAVYSPYTGHIHEAAEAGDMRRDKPGTMRDITVQTEALGIRQGMYVEQGKTIFTVYNPAMAWARLNIFAEDLAMVKPGDPVMIAPETAPGKDFRATVSFVEPFYRKDSKTGTIRVPFDNSRLGIPIGSQVKAIVFGHSRSADWLPAEAVVSLGLEKVVFVRSGEGFVARKIKAGIRHRSHVQVLSGLAATDSVASNAQYLVDSESFINPKE